MSLENSSVMKSNLLVLYFSLLFYCSFATTWLVGPTRTYKAPSAVSSLVQNGDTVLIDAGLYKDCTIWTKSNLYLAGVGNGYAHCDSAVYGEKGVWVIAAGANNITIENMEFSGASITGGEGGNGAGLRAQGGSYTIIHCYFHDNQDGILCNPTAGNDSADVLIEYSEFAYNGCANNDPSGCDPGYEHNMYIGSGYRSFTLMYSYSHGAINGHNVKTRANNNYILYNSIMDLADGMSSYDIDIAQGGPTIIMGNLIEGGPMKVNHTLMAYNEGSTNPPPQNLYLVNNTIINDQTTGYYLIMPDTADDTLTMINNIIAGPGSLFNGPFNFSTIDTTHNLISASIAAVGLVDAAAYNYQLTSTSPAINAGTNAGYVYDIAPFTPFSLTPVAEYVDSLSMESRSIVGSAIDIGAYEYGNVATGISKISSALDVAVYPNPSNGIFTVQLPYGLTGRVTLQLFDVNGQLVAAREVNNEVPFVAFGKNNLPAGVYLLKINNAGSSDVKRVVIE